MNKFIMKNQQNEMVGSSETIRKTPEIYTLSCALKDKKVYTQSFHWTDVNQCLPQHKKSYSPEFLSWFVGFSEGHGSFYRSNERLFFTITEKDAAFLHRLRTELGFGIVCNDTKYPETKRFTVTNRNHVKILIHIFNGNLLLKKTTGRFALWLQDWNRLTGDRISLKTRWEDLQELTAIAQIPGNPSGDRLDESERFTLRSNSVVWNTSWLAGFVDAEGSFTAGMESKTPLLGFLVDQTAELEILTHLRFLLGDYGSIWIRKKTPEILESGIQILKIHYRFETKDLGLLDLLINYMTRNPLRTKKNIVFFQWKKLLNLLVVLRQEKKEKKVISAPKRQERLNRLIHAIKNWKYGNE